MRRRLLAAAPALAFGWLGSTWAADGVSVRIGGTGGGVDALAQLFDGSWNAGLALSVVPSLGSGGGLKALVAGAIDVAVISRPITAEEQAQGLQAVEAFRSPLVWAVAARNRGVGALKLQELIDVYTGQMAQWPDGVPVRPVLRPASDSDTLAVQAFHPGLGQALLLALQRPGVRVAMTDTEAVDDLSQIPGAIGTTTLGLVLSSKGVLRALDVNGVAPSVRALAEGRWRAQKVIRLVTQAQAPAGATRLLQQVGGAPAQARMARLGHLPGRSS
ncbi:substrate-binding domain-containing protein [Sphaerotilus microaerophilus]|uniref:PBP domain-containing protein n=1 Tax=Sphaerotilus microaerophilus TaxID=2914710 RepID=A0ABN6PI60_9BURK|nr:substrate-binding domain-containing protein [Sphaerotilus sp. FB-5]BDI04701.1 hypothetical protein CATMQ487_16710 [Sphaerotilus sp. FB-5]